MLATPRLSPPRLNRWRARCARVLWWVHLQLPAATKRGFDLMLVVPALLLLLPLLAVVAAAIRLHGGGPALLWQRRVGRDGLEFDCPQLRLPCVDIDASRQNVTATLSRRRAGAGGPPAQGPRLTPLGQLIRRTRIDELPRLWCVLRGTMSVVGPRPPLAVEVEHYAAAERQRLVVLPGLTCLWRAQGRPSVPFEQRLQMDLDYIRAASLWTDLRVVWMSLPALMRGRSTP